ncbi:E3 14.7 protein [Simian mastadenovirus C]|uniref:E3 14.7 protein n=1 Tax=Simian mastadenovirus C TaxID=1962300 RepID=M9YVH5_9ADEN|nr:E3 14.7 protein [Simian mastadenovirus C]
MTESQDININMERGIAQRQREARAMDYLRLQELKETHWCDRGSLCLVKLASLSYDVSTQGHELSYTLAGQKQTFSTIMGSTSLKITHHSKPVEGAILCHCHKPDCMEKLITTLCAVAEIFK